MGRLFREIRYSIERQYNIWGDEGKLTIKPDTQEYFSWIANLKSFHFGGKEGHFTAQREEKKQDETYWYTYRKAQLNQFKKYIGTDDKLTIQRLEDIALEIQKKVNALPIREHKPRKKIIPKMVLRKRIKELEEKLNQQERHVNPYKESSKQERKDYASKNTQEGKIPSDDLLS